MFGVKALCLLDPACVYPADSWECLDNHGTDSRHSWRNPRATAARWYLPGEKFATWHLVGFSAASGTGHCGSPSFVLLADQILDNLTARLCTHSVRRGVCQLRLATSIFFLAFMSLGSVMARRSASSRHDRRSSDRHRSRASRHKAVIAERACGQPAAPAHLSGVWLSRRRWPACPSAEIDRLLERLGARSGCVSALSRRKIEARSALSITGAQHLALNRTTWDRRPPSTASDNVDILMWPFSARSHRLDALYDVE